MKKCSISSESGQFRGLVETSAFPDCGACCSISIVGCSFNSQEVLGTDGIGLSLTRTARKSAEDVGMISSSLIGCSFVNLSSIGSSCLPRVPHLDQKMLGCVLSLTSSHLSGSTIRDVNNGGSLLCSNSSFSSLLSSPNTDTDPFMTLPNGTYPFVDNGTVYSFDEQSGTDSSIASFTHCRFSGDNYVTNARPLTFTGFPGSISIVSCFFTNFIFHSSQNPSSPPGHTIVISQRYYIPSQPVTIQASNFTNLKTEWYTAGISLHFDGSATIDHCIFEKCGPVAPDDPNSVGGVGVVLYGSSGLLTITNLVFESCSASSGAGGMGVTSYGPLRLSDCLFDKCSSPDTGFATGGLVLLLRGDTPTEVSQMNFTDCRSHPDNAAWADYAGCLRFEALCDFTLTAIHFLRCSSGGNFGYSQGGALLGLFEDTKTLTVRDCSIVECSSEDCGGAFKVAEFGSCVVKDCLVKDCISGESGAISLRQTYYFQWSVSLTRVAFVNNSVGQNKDLSVLMNGAEDTTAFDDVDLTCLEEYRPTLSIEDYFTTCATKSIGMHMIVNRGTSEESTVS
ncbi:hypothetical protein BLNAU_17045 [Blattamonas nauphoetae]|uniref:Right handed beta helix domain-containing protein n=1 Tax=Blattamonas nauphoetae TaxID=2049346 RepID=A0ABQ9XAW8_9EUKA|nr:hypothetical protein BLNAU_17045 [Blattamonas nauphoetae]